MATWLNKSCKNTTQTPNEIEAGVQPVRYDLIQIFLKEM
jgi:hypothetical protein